uniref:Outer membrane protein beta-barrel domain-containing protein n=1 Tax=Desulfomonile tiedjei TaxID=2358 RepID=A0A7C4ES85_9BACT
MRTKHRMVLVSLLFIAFTTCSYAAHHNAIHVIVNGSQPLQGIPVAPWLAGDRANETGMSSGFVKASAPGLGYENPAGSGLPRVISKVKPAACPVASVCAAAPPKPCILPKRECGQWELSVQAYFARVRGKVSWPNHPTVDFNDDLGLDSHKTFFEYSARYQFRPRWAIIYSIMPIEMEANYVHPLFPGMAFKSKWENVYQRVGLLFEPIRTCSGAISIYNAWVFNEQKLTMHTGSHCQAYSTMKIDRTRNMVMSGIEIERCITTKCNGGSLSCDNRVGIAYLDGVFGLDVQTGLRYSIPLNCGRWGYAKGGYRLIDFKEDRIDYRIDTYLTGWFVELGLVF